MVEDTVSRRLPRWRCHKIVGAAQIRTVSYSGNGMATMILDGGVTVDVDRRMFSRYEPKPGDYFVAYDDNYMSVSPKKAFEEGYSRLDS